jgi:hypothetical protein
VAAVHDDELSADDVAAWWREPRAQPNFDPQPPRFMGASPTAETTS